MMDKRDLIMYYPLVALLIFSTIIISYAITQVWNQIPTTELSKFILKPIAVFLLISVDCLCGYGAYLFIKYKSAFTFSDNLTEVKSKLLEEKSVFHE